MGTSDGAVGGVHPFHFVGIAHDATDKHQLLPDKESDIDHPIEGLHDVAVASDARFFVGAFAVIEVEEAAVWHRRWFISPCRRSRQSEEQDEDDSQHETSPCMN